MPNEGRLGAKRWNKLADQIYDRYQRRVQMYVDELMADGHPPFSQPATPAEQLKTLMTLRDQGHPTYWQNQAAQDKLAELQERLGGAAPMPPPPMNPTPPSIPPPLGV